MTSFSSQSPRNQLQGIRLYLIFLAIWNKLESLKKKRAIFDAKALMRHKEIDVLTSASLHRCDLTVSFPAGMTGEFVFKSFNPALRITLALLLLLCSIA